MTNNIFIAAHARSGSTFLCRLLEQVVEIKVYLEIFHFQHSVIVHHLHGDYPKVEQKLQLPDDEASARREMISSNHEYIAVLQEMHKDKNILFKVFPGHLPDAPLRQVLSQSQLIVVLRRNLLQSYISGVIAKNTQKWGRVDTSNKKVVFSPDDFFTHIRQVVGYYEKVVQFALKQQHRVVYVDYEQLIATDKPLDLMISVLSEGLRHQLHGSNGVLSISRQDKRSDAADKVVNAEEMLACLDRHGLGGLNDGYCNCTDNEYRRAIDKT